MVLFTKLAARFKAAGERLKPEYHVLEEGESPATHPATVKLYGPGTQIENV